jgi:hypothetical protein
LVGKKKRRSKKKEGREEKREARPVRVRMELSSQSSAELVVDPWIRLCVLVTSTLSVLGGVFIVATTFAFRKYR